MLKTKIIISGGNGFVGSNLEKYLLSLGCAVKLLDWKRFSGFEELKEIEKSRIIDDFRSEFEGFKCFIHCAGIAHKDKKQQVEAYYKSNVLLTINMFEFTKTLGISKFIFLSSANVLGKVNFGYPFNGLSEPKPYDSYSESKLLAEDYLIKHCHRSDIQACIIRCPIIIGPKVKGNFRFLLKLASVRVPIPFKGISAKRSILGIKNLCCFLHCLIETKKDVSGVFLLSDSKSLTLTEMIVFLRQQLGLKTLNIRLPKILVIIFMSCLGKAELAKTIYSDCEIDPRETYQYFGWRPPDNVEESLKSSLQSHHSI